MKRSTPSRALLAAMCAGMSMMSVPTSILADETEPVVLAAEQNTVYADGVTVTEDAESPTGYTAHFVYDVANDDRITGTVDSVAITGTFMFIDPNKELHDADNQYGPYDYQNGFYYSNLHPNGRYFGMHQVGWTEQMTLNEETGKWEIDFPVASGSNLYSYRVTKTNGTAQTVDDPANKSLCSLNAENSDSRAGDINNSTVYGKWDPVKQSLGDNLDFVRPFEGENKGSYSYVEYTGLLSDHQDLGIYLPYGYDPDRAEPYKVIYISHGAGGNETDWFALGHADAVMDNIAANDSSKEAIIVTLDNATLGWNYANIANNVLNYVIPYMEDNYNVSTEAEDRAFCGFSMGAMTTTYMYFHHTMEFGYFGMFSGTNRSNWVTDAPNLDKPLVYAVAGTADSAILSNGWVASQAYETLRDWMQENYPDNFIDGGYVHGSHDWMTWSQALNEFAGEVCWSNSEEAEEKTDGYTLREDETSPTGYTGDFVFNPALDAGSEGHEIASVSITGTFMYIDPNRPVTDADNQFGPYDYQNGYYYSNLHPNGRMFGMHQVGWTEEMTLNEETGKWEISFPVSSGSNLYSYVITYTDGTRARTIDDPANPSLCRLNEANSDTTPGDITHSTFYGKWDPEKQSQSDNLDFVLPYEGENKGTLTYIEYEGNRSDHQDAGVYLPPNYDPDREEPYKVIYVSHGAGGNETDWFALGHADAIMDRIANEDPSKEAIIVSMDNATIGWTYSRIADNVMNYLIPYMEANYNVSTEASGRAFCGFSMGSMTTTYMFGHYPTEFGYFGMFSGTNIANLTTNDHMGDPLVYATAGTCDSALSAHGWSYSQAYETFVSLSNANIPANFVDGGLVHGSHDWMTWSQALNNFARDICWTTPEEKADTSELEAAIADALNVNEEEYTADSYAQLNSVLSLAQRVTQTRYQPVADSHTSALRAALAGLQRRASDAALNALATQVANAQLLSDQYTTEAFAPVQEAIDAANRVLENNENALQNEVVEAALNLANAIKDLPADAESTSLKQSLADTIQFIETDILTRVENVRPGKVQELRQVLADAKLILASDASTPDQYKEAIEALTQKAQELWAIVSKDELNAVLEAAKNIGAEGFTPESYEILQAAIAASQGVAENPDATVEEVSAAINRVTSAIAALETLELDKAALETEISIVSVMVENIDDYVPSTVRDLEAKLESAKDTLANAASQEEIDEAVAMLREARLNARTKADRSALQSAVEAASQIDFAQFTEATAQPAMEAFLNAQIVLGMEDANQAEIDAATESLLNALNALEALDGSLDQVDQLVPDTTVNDVTTGSLGATVDSAVQPGGQSTTDSAVKTTDVKTAMHTGLGYLTATAAAALSGLLIIKKLRNKK